MMWRGWWRVNKSPILSILMDFCCLLVRSSSGLVVLMFKVPLFSFFLLCVSVFTFLPVFFVVSLFTIHLRCVVLFFLFSVFSASVFTFPVCCVCCYCYLLFILSLLLEGVLFTVCFILLSFRALGLCFHFSCLLCLLFC